MTLAVLATLTTSHVLATDVGIPKRTGACVDTTIAEISGVYRSPVPNNEGAIVGYANGLAGVSFKQEPEIERSKVGDPIRLCLVEIDKDCRRNDPRGRTYSATNLRTGGSWRLGNSMHACGGA
jgi:hypothetical protein